MARNRRQFLGHLAAVSAGGAFLPSALGAAAPGPVPVSADWDLSWRDRIGGSFRAVFDSPAVNDGAGLWRAADWKRTVLAVYGEEAKDAASVLVVRHEAIPMIVNHEYWERHEVSKKDKINDPSTGKAVKHNPFLSLDPEKRRGSSLDGFIAGGGIVLACNYAFQFLVSREAKKLKVENAEAREATLKFLIPGVILQPSGFFAVIEAQRSGCHFFPASG